MLFKSLLKCHECDHTFRARNERGKIKYRCNNRLKNGLNACSNSSVIEEDTLLYHVQKQFELYNINFEPSNDCLKNYIECVIIEENNTFTILYKDQNLKPTIVTDNKIAYGTI